jgi:transaldolase
VEDVAELGSDIATIPGTLFPKLWSHPLTDAGIQAFLKDWEAFKK